eukprot:gene20898-47572_t
MLLLYVPTCALGAIILSAALHLTDFDAAVWLYKCREKCSERRGLLVWITAFCATLGGGIVMGVMISVALSLVLLLIQVSQTEVVELGRVEVTVRIQEHIKPGKLSASPGIAPERRFTMWRSLQHFGKHATTVPGIAGLKLSLARRDDRPDRRLVDDQVCDAVTGRSPTAARAVDVGAAV